jgi:hypothetical protein
MQLYTFAFAALGFASAALGAVVPVVPRQALAIRAVLEDIQDEAIVLKDIFEAATGTASEVNAIRAQNAALLASINAAKPVISASPVISVLDALGFAGTVASLQQSKSYF